jgi:hypothetical protein
VTEGIPEPSKEQNSWLFTRGQESICIVRVTLAYGRMRLLIRGPGYVVTDLHFPNLAACSAHQQEFEDRMTYEGFKPTPDRRTGKPRPADAPAAERRVPLPEL